MGHLRRAGHSGASDECNPPHTLSSVIDHFLRCQHDFKVFRNFMMGAILDYTTSFCRSKLKFRSETVALTVIRLAVGGLTGQPAWSKGSPRTALVSSEFRFCARTSLFE